MCQCVYKKLELPLMQITIENFNVEKYGWHGHLMCVWVDVFFFGLK